MAGVDVGSGRGRRRALDSEINMVPMIDLMMVTVSFLLLTAVWTHTARLDGTARVPGRSDPFTVEEPAARVHVEVPPDEGALKVTLRRGVQILETKTVPRRETANLGSELEAMRRSHPYELASDASHVVVLHTDDGLHYSEMVAVMDAISANSKYRVSLATK